LTLRRLKSAGIDPNRVACNIIDNFLSDAYRHGMFHADLHPANLMIKKGNVVGYIDFGITGVLSQYSRSNLIALTLAYTRADLDGMCTSFIKCSAMGANGDVQAFREGLRNLADEWYGMERGERRLLKNFTLVMFDMLKLSRQTDIWPERDVIKYIRSAIAIDGLITRFAPAFNLGQYLEAVCDKYLKWQWGRALFSYDTFIDWADSGGRLMRNGAFRADSFLQQFASGEVRAQAEIINPKRQSEEALRLRAMLLGAIAFLVSLLITVTSERLHPGINLVTAEAVLVAASAMMFMLTVHRLT
jgi:predicted unusual protein kinase regulating ubiquinone biosynthesis (AarF/ABC1/UbiB family)